MWVEYSHGWHKCGYEFWSPKNPQVCHGLKPVTLVVSFTLHRPCAVGFNTYVLITVSKPIFVHQIDRAPTFRTGCGHGSTRCSGTHTGSTPTGCTGSAPGCRDRT